MGGRKVPLAAVVSVTMLPTLAEARVPDTSSRMTTLAQSTTSTSSRPFWTSRGGRKLIGLGVVVVVGGIAAVFKRND